MTGQSGKLLGLVLLAFLAGNVAAAPVVTVAGIVTDEQGSLLEGVKVQLCGMEELRNGVWVRVYRLGEMPFWTTDKQGRFVIEFNEPGMRYDFWFEKHGFAPTFLYGISAESEDLKVLLKRGVLVTGTVTRLVRGKEKPVEWVEVVLSGPSTDLMYRQGSVTDHNGKYTFRAGPAPPGKNWSVLFLNESIEIDIGEEGPVAGPDFVVELTVREKPKGVQPDAPADSGQAAPLNFTIENRDQSMTRTGYIGAVFTVAWPFVAAVCPFGFTSWRRAGP